MSNGCERLATRYVHDHLVGLAAHQLTNNFTSCNKVAKELQGEVVLSARVGDEKVKSPSL